MKYEGMNIPTMGRKGVKEFMKKGSKIKALKEAKGFIKDKDTKNDDKRSGK